MLTAFRETQIKQLIYFFMTNSYGLSSNVTKADHKWHGISERYTIAGITPRYSIATFTSDRASTEIQFTPVYRIVLPMLNMPFTIAGIPQHAWLA